ncbi:MAG: DUF3421 domain-containing protein [Algicola sp.]|nr:DUF3421 domain-containing protein [Algicola sp.]
MKKTTLLGAVALALLATNSMNANAYVQPDQPGQGTWVYAYELADMSDVVNAGETGTYPNNHGVYVCADYYSLFSIYPGSYINGYCYSTFNSKAWSDPYHHWVLEQPEDPALKYSWTTFTGWLPNNSVIGGHEYGSVQYSFICRAQYYNDWVIGKYIPNHGCYLPYESKEHLYKTNFDVLVQPSTYAGVPPTPAPGPVLDGPTDTGDIMH